MDKDAFGSLMLAFDFPQKHLELHTNDKSKHEKNTSKQASSYCRCFICCPESGTTLVIKSILEQIDKRIQI